MKMNFHQIMLLRRVVMYTGEKRINIKGQEEDVSRSFSTDLGVHIVSFFNLTKSIVEEINKEKNKKNKIYKQFISEKKEELKKANPNKESMLKKDYEEYIDSLLELEEDVIEKFEELKEDIIVLLNKEHEISFSDKIKNVCKKYFKDFDKNDAFKMSEIQTALELKNLLK